MNLNLLIRNHRKGVTIIFTLIIVENLAWIIEPTVFGKLIDSFIIRWHKPTLKWQMEHLFPLITWVFVYMVNSGTGTIRRLLELGVFQKMTTEIVTKIASYSKKFSVNPSIAAARSQLSQEYITFLQYRVPEGIEQLISIVGAIIALTLFDYRISITCLSVTIPLVIIGFVYNKKVAFYQKEYHDNFENIYDVFLTKEPGEIKEYYNLMTKNQMKIANWGAVNFGSVRMVLLVIFIVVLYISIDIDDFSTGSIYSIVSYLWSFVSSIEYLPDLMESRTSLSDISGRIKTEDYLIES